MLKFINELINFTNRKFLKGELQFIISMQRVMNVLIKIFNVFNNGTLGNLVLTNFIKNV